MVGKTILHYKILEKIGEGGMGVVYKAEDTKLERTVAIKLLPRQIAVNSEEHERFKIEAKAAASLNHTNIATIYAIEEVDGDTFIVMEYIKGKELKELTTADGELSIKDVTDYATQIAEGLKAAHKKGVTHRDIKSSNIMITDEDQVKIMDFGLAKVRGGTQVTKAGTTLGTAAYMSPEQARGEEADHRSDIWSFGVVLYEMLTGKLPFGGDYEQAVMYAIMNEEPEVPSEIPANLKPILGKALKKDAAKRYQHVDELLSDLQLAEKGEVSVRVETGSKAPQPRKLIYLYASIAFAAVALTAVAFFGPFRPDSQTIDSIAVLPLENLSGDATQDYFADGMTEALIMNLSKIRNLKVISRTSVMQYKQTKKTLPEIADELGVKAVIEGSVIREGDQVRITAQLIEAETEKHLWADSYDRNLTNILSLQSEIALAIAGQIKVVLSPAEKKRLTAAQAVDPKAHENYLKGLQHLHKDTEVDLLQSIDYFSRAIELAPTYAIAHAELANAYQRLAGNTYKARDEAYPRALAAVKRALELEPELNEAHLALARIKFILEWDWDGAEKAFLKVLEQNPNSAKGHERYAIFLVLMGRFEESTREILMARELDPLSAWTNNNVGWVYYFQRRYEEALVEYQKTIEMFPGFIWAYREQAMVYMCLGKPDKAILSADKAVSISDDDPYNLVVLGLIYALAGERERAEEILHQLLQRAKSKPIPQPEFSLIFAALGDLDRAFDHLEQAYETRNGWLFQIKVDPIADHLRSDPRYATLLRKMGLEP